MLSFVEGGAARVEPGAHVVDSVVDADATVCDGARVVRSVILPGARIGVGAVVTESIVAGEVDDAARLERCVVGAGHRAGGTHRDARLPAPE